MADVVRLDPSTIDTDAPSQGAPPTEADVVLRLASWLATVSLEADTSSPSAPDAHPAERQAAGWDHCWDLPSRASRASMDR